MGKRPISQSRFYHVRLSFIELLESQDSTAYFLPPPPTPNSSFAFRLLLVRPLSASVYTVNFEKPFPKMNCVMSFKLGRSACYSSLSPLRMVSDRASTAQQTVNISTSCTMCSLSAAARPGANMALFIVAY